MKNKDAIPSIAYLVEIVESYGNAADKGHLNRVKNWLRAKEPIGLSAAALNGTGCHKKPCNNKNDRGICI